MTDINEPQITVVVDGWEYELVKTKYLEDGGVVIVAEPKKGYVDED